MMSRPWPCHVICAQPRRSSRPARAATASRLGTALSSGCLAAASCGIGRLRQHDSCSIRIQAGRVFQLQLDAFLSRPFVSSSGLRSPAVFSNSYPPHGLSADEGVCSKPAHADGPVSAPTVCGFQWWGGLIAPTSAPMPAWGPSAAALVACILVGFGPSFDASVGEMPASGAGGGAGAKLDGKECRGLCQVMRLFWGSRWRERAYKKQGEGRGPSAPHTRAACGMRAAPGRTDLANRTAKHICIGSPCIGMWYVAGPFFCGLLTTLLWSTSSCCVCAGVFVLRKHRHDGFRGEAAEAEEKTEEH